MSHYNLALLGFGNVGQALARLLLRKQDELKQRYDLTFCVTGIGTGRHGMVVNRDGIDLEQALALIQSGESLQSLPATARPGGALEFIRESGAGVLFENTPVNYQTGQPAIDHLKAAIEMGMHAITANKGPVVHAYRDLTDLAKAHGVRFYFESTVMDGAPIFSLYRETIPAAQVLGFRGVLNSTTNMILTRMEQGDTFAEAVAHCQAIGIAETDPSGDIDGWDAAIKVAALATVLMGSPLKPQDVDRQGIRGITEQEVRQAAAEDKRWKLVCSVQRDGDRVRGRVTPEKVAADSPMYGVMGTTSILQLETDVLGLLSIIEEDPGPHTTAYGLFADFLNAVRPR